jgi:endonuclease YncB( thermonuclease family)
VKLSDLIFFYRRPKPRPAPAKFKRPAKELPLWEASGLERLRVAAPTKSEARAQFKKHLGIRGRGRLPITCTVTRVVILLLVFLAIAGGAFGQQLGIPSNHYLLSSVSVYDGDTITCDVHLGLDVVLHDQRVRLAGFDAWELTRARRTVNVTEEEIAKGEKARDYLQELLGAGAAYLVPEVRGKDPYGRLLGRLVVGTEEGPLDVAEQMRRDGHDRDYRPHRPERQVIGLPEWKALGLDP